MATGPVVTFVDGLRRDPKADGPKHPVFQTWLGYQKPNGPVIWATKDVADLSLLFSTIEAHPSFNELRANLRAYATVRSDSTIDSKLVLAPENVTDIG